jgi:hypothetical protein
MNASIVRQKSLSMPEKDRAMLYEMQSALMKLVKKYYETHKNLSAKEIYDLVHATLGAIKGMHLLFGQPTEIYGLPYREDRNEER